MTIPGAGGQVPPRADQQLIPAQPVPVSPGSSDVVRARQVIVSSGGAGQGIFLYSGTPRLGNPPVAWMVAPGVTTDPFGNTVAGTGFGNPSGARITIDQFGELLSFNAAGQLALFLQPSLESFLIYTPPAATGSLAASLAAAGGTDNFGNHFLAGAAAYGSTFAASLQAGILTFYAGSLASGWSATGAIEADNLGDMFVLAAPGRSVSTNNNTLDDGSGHMTVTGLTVNGSTNTGTPAPNATSTNGLADGTIHGTSGGASAGTAHTHGPGSFAVGSGQHSHDLQNHDHPL